MKLLFLNLIAIVLGCYDHMPIGKDVVIRSQGKISILDNTNFTFGHQLLDCQVSQVYGDQTKITLLYPEGRVSIFHNHGNKITILTFNKIELTTTSDYQAKDNQYIFYPITVRVSRPLYHWQEVTLIYLFGLCLLVSVTGWVLVKYKMVFVSLNWYLAYLLYNYIQLNS